MYFKFLDFLFCDATELNDSFSAAMTMLFNNIASRCVNLKIVCDVFNMGVLCQGEIPKNISTNPTKPFKVLWVYCAHLIWHHPTNQAQ